MKFITSTLIVTGVLLLIAVATTSCTNRANESASAPATAPFEASIPGVILWTNNCIKCHNLRSPTEFNDAQWGLISTHMRLRANLTGEETRQILDFLQSSN